MKLPPALFFWMWGQAQGAPDDIPALVLVNAPQKVGNTVLISNVWVVRVDNGLESSAKIRRDVARSQYPFATPYRKI